MNATAEHAALNPLRLWCVLLVLLWAGLCANAQAQVDPNDLTVADLASYLIILTRDLQELEERVYSLERGVEQLELFEAALIVIWSRYTLALEDGPVTAEALIKIVEEVLAPGE